MLLKNIISNDYFEKYANTEEEMRKNFLQYANIDIKIEEIYTLDRADNIDIDVVNCKIRNSKNKIKIIVKIDYSNNAFCIYPFVYTENDINDIKKENVEQNEYNQYEPINISEEQIVEIIFDDYKEELLYYQDEAYEKLDSEYSKQKFQDKNDFYEYIERNRDNIQSSYIQKYKIENYDDYTKYICIDNQNNYYIFTETSIMKYTVMLDTYTLELPEFIEKYNSATPQEKVALNIQKFMQAIDLKDYNYAYNCLADGFKKNYFGNIDEFKKYVEENFYSRNLVTYTKFEEEAGLYKYTVNIDNADYGEGIKTKTFIMQLNEGTDFEMSFNI